ncbi:MAG: hypothetical protein U1G07_16410 [Verrucomicrobiota bacterium]
MALHGRRGNVAGLLGSEAKRLGQAAIVFGSAFAMFLVGFWDDVQPIGAKKKLIFQILIASCVYAGGIHIDAVSNPFGVESSITGVGYIVTVLWLITLTNLINLIDGIDGLAGGISLMVMGLLLFLGFGKRAAILRWFAPLPPAAL